MASIRDLTTITNLPKNKRTAEYIFSDAMLEIMLRHGMAKDRALGLFPQCDSDYGVVPESVDIIDPIDFPEGAQHPTKGTWSIRYRLLRCGAEKVYNSVFVASGESTAPVPHSYFPGSTNAGAQLIRDTMPTALAIARARSNQQDCRKVEVFDMVVSQAAHLANVDGKAVDGVWNEKWTFLLCGRKLDINLRFAPDAANGGTVANIE